MKIINASDLTPAQTDALEENLALALKNAPELAHLIDGIMKCFEQLARENTALKERCATLESENQALKSAVAKSNSLDTNFREKAGY